MAILKIYTFPDPVLKQKAAPVTEFDSKLKKLVDDMLETMYDAPGVGLAANQIGVLERVIVIDIDYNIEGEEDDLRRYVGKVPRVFINPELTQKTGTMLYKEGCLSVPGYSEEVKRFSSVTVKYQDRDGNEHSLDGSGLLGVAIQHEIDHLDGKLFIDRLSPIKKGLIKGKIKKERGGKFERSKFHVEL
jgi:peptide deformylase